MGCDEIYGIPWVKIQFVDFTKEIKEQASVLSPWFLWCNLVILNRRMCGMVRDWLAGMCQDKANGDKTFNFVEEHFFFIILSFSEISFGYKSPWRNWQKSCCSRLLNVFHVFMQPVEVSNNSSCWTSQPLLLCLPFIRRRWGRKWELLYVSCSCLFQIWEELLLCSGNWVTYTERPIYLHN